MLLCDLFDIDPDDMKAIQQHTIDPSDDPQEVRQAQIELIILIEVYPPNWLKNRCSWRDSDFVPESRDSVYKIIRRKGEEKRNEQTKNW